MLRTSASSPSSTSRVSLLGVLAVLPAVLMLAERARARGPRPRAASEPGGRRLPAAAAGVTRRPRRRDRRRARPSPSRDRLHLAQLAAHRGAGLARRARPGASCRRSPCRWRCRGSRATRTCPRRRATCAARTCSTCASWPSAARSCSAFFAEPLRPLRRPDRRGRPAPLALPGRAVRRRRDPRRPRRRCGAGCASAGWTLPVGYDHDGAVANAYGSRSARRSRSRDRGGKVARTLLGVQSERALVAAVQGAGVSDEPDRARRPGRARARRRASRAVARVDRRRGDAGADAAGAARAAGGDGGPDPRRRRDRAARPRGPALLPRVLPPRRPRPGRRPHPGRGA